jgi:hypothetical protein
MPLTLIENRHAHVPPPAHPPTSSGSSSTSVRVAVASFAAGVRELAVERMTALRTAVLVAKR